MFTQNVAAARRLGQVAEDRATQKATSGGSSDTDVKELTDRPRGWPPDRQVTTVTPVAKWPRTWRYRASSILLGAGAKPGESIGPG
jgi:hypothetical protein